MSITINKSILHTALIRLKSISDKYDQLKYHEFELPVFSIDKNYLEIIFSKREINYSDKIKILNKGVSEIKFSCDLDDLIFALSLFDEETIMISLSEQNIIIQSEQMKYNLNIKPNQPNYFSNIEEELVYLENINLIKFQKVLQKAKYFLSDDWSRPQLSFPYFKVKNGKLTITGTDGFKLYESNIEIEYIGEDFPFVVDHISLLNLHGQICNISITKNRVIFRTTNQTVALQKKEIKFEVEFIKLVKNEEFSIYEINHDLLKTTIEKAIKFSHHYGCYLECDKNLVIIKILDYENITKMEVQIPVICQSRESIRNVRLNPKILLEVLKQIDEINIVLKVSEQNLVIERYNELYFIMNMKKEI